MCMLDYCDPCDVFNCAERRAIKPHRCGDCSRQIERFERYRHYSFLSDGSWSHTNLCAHCYAAAEWLRANCGGYVLEAIKDDLREHLDEYRWAGWLGVARLVKGMEHQWRIERGPRAGQLMPIPTGMPATIDERARAA